MATDARKWILMGVVLVMAASCAQPVTQRQIPPPPVPEPKPVVRTPPAPTEPAAEPALAGRPEAGKALLIKHDCLNCHSVRGRGGTKGPDLAQVAVRRSHEWLFDFVFIPSEKFPEAEMPQFDWDSEQEVADVVAFLESIKRDIPVDRIFAANLGTLKTGQVLVEAYDCRACHTIGEGGVVGYPDLTYVGSKIRPEWEARWLKDPQKIKPGTFMPTFGFSDREREAVVAYLSSLKWDRPPGGPMQKEK